MSKAPGSTASGGPAPIAASDAVAAMAALTWKRTLRSRTLRISAILTMLPAAVGVALSYSSMDHAELWSALLRTQLVLMAVLCPIYAAASLGDEIESGTLTYLWSRPLPRWTIAAGKLVALTPIVAIMLVVSGALAMGVATRAAPPLAGLLALILGAATLSVAATGIAMLVPRHSMVVPMAFMLFVDLPMGELPLALAQLSMTHHLRVLGDGTAAAAGATGSALVWLLGLTSVWAAIGLWRLRRFE